MGYRVLQHHHPVLIIQISQGKRILPQTIKKSLFSLYIRLKSFVIIQMIMRYIGENRTVKIQSADTTLIYGMRTHLHETIFTSGIHHPPH